jgi:PilZ domain
MTKVICPARKAPIGSETSRTSMNNPPKLTHPRFALATTVVLREAANDAVVLAKLKNISLSGCYLETPRETPVRARVRILVQTADLRVDLWGVVQRRDENGLGIAFTNGATVEDWKALELLIDELHGKVPAKSASASK